MSEFLVLAEAVLEMRRIFALHLVASHEDGTAATVDCYLDASSASAPIISLRMEGQDARMIWDSATGASGQSLHVTRFSNWAFDLGKICVIRYHTRKAELTFMLGDHSYTIGVESPRALQELRQHQWNKNEVPAAVASC